MMELLEPPSLVAFVRAWLDLFRAAAAGNIQISMEGTRDLGSYLSRLEPHDRRVIDVLIDHGFFADPFRVLAYANDAAAMRTAYNPYLQHADPEVRSAFATFAAAAADPRPTVLN